MRVRKSGNGLAVDLPVSVVERLGLKEGDTVAIEVAEDATLRVSLPDPTHRAVPRPGEDAAPVSIETDEERRAAAIARLRSLNWVAPPGFRFNREEANER